MIKTSLKLQVGVVYQILLNFPNFYSVLNLNHNSALCKSGIDCFIVSFRYMNC